MTISASTMAVAGTVRVISATVPLRLATAEVPPAASPVYEKSPATSPVMLDENVAVNNMTFSTAGVVVPSNADVIVGVGGRYSHIFCMATSLGGDTPESISPISTMKSVSMMSPASVTVTVSAHTVPDPVATDERRLLPGGTSAKDVEKSSVPVLVKLKCVAFRPLMAESNVAVMANTLELAVVHVNTGVGGSKTQSCCGAAMFNGRIPPDSSLMTEEKVVVASPPVGVMVSVYALGAAACSAYAMSFVSLLGR